MPMQTGSSRCIVAMSFISGSLTFSMPVTARVMDMDTCAMTSSKLLTKSWLLLSVPWERAMLADASTIVGEA